MHDFRLIGTRIAYGARCNLGAGLGFGAGAIEFLLDRRGRTWRRDRAGLGFIQADQGQDENAPCELHGSVSSVPKKGIPSVSKPKGRLVWRCSRLMIPMKLGTASQLDSGSKGFRTVRRGGRSHSAARSVGRALNRQPGAALAARVDELVLTAWFSQSWSRHCLRVCDPWSRAGNSFQADVRGGVGPEETGVEELREAPARDRRAGGEASERCLEEIEGSDGSFDQGRRTDQAAGRKGRTPLRSRGISKVEGCLGRITGSDETSCGRVGSTPPSPARRAWALWTAVSALQLPSQLDLGHEAADLVEAAKGDLLFIACHRDPPVRGDLQAIDGARTAGIQGDESLTGFGVPELEETARDRQQVRPEGLPGTLFSAVSACGQSETNLPILQPSDV